MGLSGISPLSLLLIVALILFFFGPKKLKAWSTELGQAIQQFRQALANDDHHKKNQPKD